MLAGIALQQAGLHQLAGDHPRWPGNGGSPGLAALLLLTAAALLRRPSRRAASVAVMLVSAYLLSDRYLAATLTIEILWLVPIAAMALFIFWPRLIEAPRHD